MKKIIVSIIVYTVVLITLLYIFSEYDVDSNSTSNNETISTMLSCYNEEELSNYKKRIDYISYLDKNNKLVGFEKIEKYYDFKKEKEYNNTCDSLNNKVENKNEYLNEKIVCNKNFREVTIYDEYDLLKVSDKKILLEDINESLDDSFILDVEKYKKDFFNKDYFCKEK